MPPSTTGTQSPNRADGSTGTEIWTHPQPPAPSPCHPVLPSPRRGSVPPISLPAAGEPRLFPTPPPLLHTERPFRPSSRAVCAHTAPTRALLEPDPRSHDPAWAAPDPAGISCEPEQLGVSALPSPCLFILGKKRLIKLRKYPFSPPSEA